MVKRTGGGEERSISARASSRPHIGASMRALQTCNPSVKGHALQNWGISLRYIHCQELTDPP